VKQRDGSILFSPSDLNAFLECEHLTQLELAVARSELTRPDDANPQADLVKRKGDEHEAAYLAELIADGREVVTIPNDWNLDVASPHLLEIRCHTIEQMRMVNALCRFVEEALPL
jgi:uncharacterized protein